MIRRLHLLLPAAGAMLLAGCGPTAPTPVVHPAPISEKPAKPVEAGLDRVMGKTAADLTALFGPADLDSREGQARRMQFAGPACVLDAYFYPAKEGAQPTVSYIDARLPTGEDLDRASCIAALSRRAAAP